MKRDADHERPEPAGQGAEAGTARTDAAEGADESGNAFVFFNDLDGNGWIIRPGVPDRG